MSHAKPERSRVVVLQTRPLREADWLVTFLSEHGGKRTGVAPHARRSRKRFSAALERGVVGELCYRERPHTELVLLENVHIEIAPPRRATSMAHYATQGVMLDIVHAMTVAQTPTTAKFALVVDSLNRIYAGANAQQTLTHFLLRWITHSGFAPEIDSCTHCNRPLGDEAVAIFGPIDGGALCGACGKGGGWSIPFAAHHRAQWRMLAASDDFTPAAELLSPDPNFFRDALWQYLHHMIGHRIPSSPFWSMVWSAQQ